MRKKVTIYTIPNGKLEYRGYEDKDDNYFLDLYKDDPGVKKIVRQYYPLKDNPKVTLWDKRKVPKIENDKCSECGTEVVYGDNEYEPSLKHATCPKCGISWTIGK